MGRVESSGAPMLSLDILGVPPELLGAVRMEEASATEAALWGRRAWLPDVRAGLIPGVASRRSCTALVTRGQTELAGCTVNVGGSAGAQRNDGKGKNKECE